MLRLLYYIIDMIIIVYGLYYFFTGVFVFIKSRKKINEHSSINKFAILIAARNEENVIGNLVKSLKKQDYPEELYDIFVLPNNCDDKTEEQAVLAGANIIHCEGKMRSKGDVLKYAFKKLVLDKDEGYDAFCIFDADNVVHPNFLKKMNDTICSGYKVAQGYRDSKNPSDSWIASCYSVYYWVQNYFFNESRMNMGWSASINGTGFMVKKEVIKEYGFNTVTLTEDIEFSAQCACNNIKIAFVKDAITYDEQPITFKESWKQRKRWSKGTLQCLKTYFRPLVETSVTKDVPQGLDMALFFLAPLIQSITTVLFVGAFIYQLFSFDILNIMESANMYSAIVIMISYIITVAVSTFVVIIEEKKTSKIFLGIGMFALFMLSWVPINIIAMFSKKQVWEPIKHNKSLEIEHII